MMSERGMTNNFLKTPFPLLFELVAKCHHCVSPICICDLLKVTLKALKVKHMLQVDIVRENTSLLSLARSKLGGRWVSGCVHQRAPTKP